MNKDNELYFSCLRLLTVHILSSYQPSLVTCDFVGEWNPCKTPSWQGGSHRFIGGPAVQKLVAAAANANEQHMGACVRRVECALLASYGEHSCCSRVTWSLLEEIWWNRGQQLLKMSCLCSSKKILSFQVYLNTSLSFQWLQFPGPPKNFLKRARLLILSVAWFARRRLVSGTAGDIDWLNSIEIGIVICCSPWQPGTCWKGSFILLSACSWAFQMLLPQASGFGSSEHDPLNTAFNILYRLSPGTRH